MKSQSNLFVGVLFAGLFTVWGQAVPDRKQVIIVDPGHGGIDPGAIGINGLQEKEVTLQLAKAIVAYNRTLLEDRYAIYLTRYGDTLISLGHRTKLAKVLQPSLFISLHCNHADHPKATGLEVYVFNGPVPKRNITMAKMMDSYLQEHLGYRSRGVKWANFQVLRDNRQVCPALLLELGFLSHRDEARHLEDKEKVRALGLALLMGIQTLLQ